MAMSMNSIGAYMFESLFCFVFLWWICFPETALVVVLENKLGEASMPMELLCVIVVVVVVVVVCKFERSSHPWNPSLLFAIYLIVVLCFGSSTRRAFPAQLSCGHRFCQGCWRDHVKAAVDSSDAGVCCGLACPACACPISRSDVQRLVDVSYFAKYERLVSQLYARVASSKYIRRCPNHSCDLAVVAPSTRQRHQNQNQHQNHNTSVVGSHTVTVTPPPAEEVACLCGHHFCFACGKEPHAPATCTEAAMWNTLRRQAGSGEHMSHKDAEWLKKHKCFFCPQCKMPGTRKFGGCNHITCLCGTYVVRSGVFFIFCLFGRGKVVFRRVVCFPDATI